MKGAGSCFHFAERERETTLTCQIPNVDMNKWPMVVNLFCTAIPAWQRPISEAKQGWAWLVLGWETAWEYQVLYALFLTHLETEILQCAQVVLHERGWKLFSFCRERERETTLDCQIPNLEHE